MNTTRFGSFPFTTIFPPVGPDAFIILSNSSEVMTSSYLYPYFSSEEGSYISNPVATTIVPTENSING